MHDNTFLTHRMSVGNGRNDGRRQTTERNTNTKQTKHTSYTYPDRQGGPNSTLHMIGSGCVIACVHRRLRVGCVASAASHQLRRIGCVVGC